MVFTELIGNPKLDVVDLKAVSELVHAHGIPLIIDSTTATPYLIHPFAYGADVVVRSSSKYINGGGNAISGVIVDSGNFPLAQTAGMTDSDPMPKHWQVCLSGKAAECDLEKCGRLFVPDECVSELRGTGKRWAARWNGSVTMRCSWRSLSGHAWSGVEVNYPALEKSPYYSLVQRKTSSSGQRAVRF